ncbi:MAG: N-acetyl-gamma-glutamyl-phosphate reductase, partial [Bacteroidota bacterium]|nr:N-acetyl-gamma-glutamyl-phosphate reductase [Bacteroidota bacterium]
MKTKKIRVGIVGASGYTGSELIRLLLNHPNVNISFALSKTNNQKKITDLYNDLIDETDLSFVDKFNNDVDVIFLCSGHNKSIEFINNNQIKSTTKIIDLSQDFRNNNFHEKSNRKFIYGLPEINKKIISRSKNIANPGCFATAILLGLIPSVKFNFPEDDIHINAITGSTGAGIIPKESTHF